MSLGQAVRIVIADGDPLFRSNDSGVCSARAELEVVGLAANGREAIRLTEELEPNLVLLDASMPVLDGVAAPRIIRDGVGPPTVVVVNGEDDGRAGAAHLGACRAVISARKVAAPPAKVRPPSRGLGRYTVAAESQPPLAANSADFVRSSTASTRVPQGLWKGMWIRRSGVPTRSGRPRGEASARQVT